MSLHRSSFLRKSLWVLGGFAGSAGIRFALNTALTHLLAPKIMGVMVVVNAVRLGIELLTDVGIEQNIIHHADGLTPRFRNAAWTLQLLRGGLLSCLFFAASPLLASLYHIDVRIFLVTACAPLIGAMHSTAVFALVKQLEVTRRNIFELSCEAAAFLVSIGLTLWLRSVWGPVFALLAATAIRSVFSYALPDARQRLAYDAVLFRQSGTFGKWIALTSLVMYAATNLDRLYFGRVVPLSLIGVYGLARSIAELPTNLSRRISYQIIFPAMAQARVESERAPVLRQIAKTRGGFVLLACCGLAVGAGVSDYMVATLYDPRYASTGWMLAVLLTGSIFAVLSNLNEALLLGAGKPAYSSYANLMRLITLAIGIPLGFFLGGFPLAVCAVAMTELLQYCYNAIGMWRASVGFWAQDGLAVLSALALLATTLVLRQWFGLGSPFQLIWSVHL